MLKEEDQVDTIVIAAGGTDNCAHFRKGQEKLKNIKRLILQPMNERVATSIPGKTGLPS